MSICAPDDFGWAPLGSGTSPGGDRLIITLAPCVSPALAHPCGVILCASGLRFRNRGDIDGLVRLAVDTGFDGIAVGPECPIPAVTPLCTAALAAGLAIPVASALLTEGPLDPGRRLPYLAALDDDDERRAALTAFSALLEQVVPLGVRLAALNLGQVKLGADMAAVAFRYARRELEEGESGDRLWAAALGERRALSERVLDACRRALDRILPRAERHGVRLAVEIAAAPWGIPSPRETSALLQEYVGGPLGVVWDEARAAASVALGVPVAAERRAALAAAALLWRANDAVGMHTGFLPGLGTPSRESSEDADHVRGVAKPPGIPVIVAGRPDSTTREVSGARERFAAAAKAEAAAAAAASAVTVAADARQRA